MSLSAPEQHTQPPDASSGNTMLTVTGVARRLSLTRQNVWKLISSGKLAARKDDRGWFLVNVSEVARAELERRMEWELLRRRKAKRRFK